MSLHKNMINDLITGQ